MRSRSRIDGEVLTRTIWLSIDPYMRGRLLRPAVLRAAGADRRGDDRGDRRRGDCLAPCRASRRATAWSASRGWQSHAVTQGERLTKVDRDGAAVIDLSRRAGHAGDDGLFGHDGYRPGRRRVKRSWCPPRPGRSARWQGSSPSEPAHASSGVAGGRGEVPVRAGGAGFDDCVDHRSLDLQAELQAACPNGIDVYFENVGGRVQQAAFALLNPFARVVMCGMVSQYNEDASCRPDPIWISLLASAC